MLVAICVVSMCNTSIWEEVLKHHFPRISQHWTNRVGEDLEQSFTTYAPSLARNAEKRQHALHSMCSWEPSTPNNHMLAILHIRLRVILSTEPDYQRRWMPACAASTRLSRRWEISPLLIIAKHMNKLGSSAWVIKNYGACPSSKLSASLFWQQGESRGALVI